MLGAARRENSGGETRRVTCGEFLTAVQEFRTSVLSSDAHIETEARLDGRRLVAKLRGPGRAFEERLPSTFIAMTLTTPDQETVEQANHLDRFARRFAVARAVYGPAERIRDEVRETFFIAERALLTQSGGTLG